MLHRTSEELTRCDEDRSFDGRPQNVPEAMKNVLGPTERRLRPAVGRHCRPRPAASPIVGVPGARVEAPSSTDSERRPCAMSHSRRAISVPSRSALNSKTSPDSVESLTPATSCPTEIRTAGGNGSPGGEGEGGDAVGGTDGEVGASRGYSSSACHGQHEQN